MNFFFGINNNEIKCKITVPKFQNHTKTSKTYKLFRFGPNKNENWDIGNLNCDQDEYFYYIENQNIDQNSFFLLATNPEIENFIDDSAKRLININNFTDTVPAFRSNMRIYNSVGGFSSYQSEYPFSMSTKNGSILSPMSPLLNRDADYNKVFITNIFHQPLKERFKIYFVDIVEKKILDEKEIYSNSVNEIDIENHLIDKSIYLFTKNYLGVPVFISSKNNHLSCEHTHPPHEYIISSDRFLTISKLKEQVNEFVS